jgi:hypothetical protein
MVTVEGQTDSSDGLVAVEVLAPLSSDALVRTRTFGDIANAETVCPSGTVIRYVVMYIGWRIIDYR